MEKDLQKVVQREGGRGREKIFLAEREKLFWPKGRRDEEEERDLHQRGESDN